MFARRWIVVLLVLCASASARGDEPLFDVIALSPPKCRVPGCSNCHTLGRDARGAYIVHQDFDGVGFRHVWTEYTDSVPRDDRRAAIEDLRQKIISVPDKPVARKRGSRVKRNR